MDKNDIIYLIHEFLLLLYNCNCRIYKAMQHCGLLYKTLFVFLNTFSK